MKFVGIESFFSVDKLFGELSTVTQNTVLIFGTVYYLFFTEKDLPIPGTENMSYSGVLAAMFLVMWLPECP